MRARSRQCGFALVELGITVAIVVVLAGIGLAIVPGILSSQRAVAEVRNLQAISSKVKTLFAMQADYATLTQPMLVNLKAFPEEYMEGGDDLVNRWGGTLTVARATLGGVPDNAFTLTLTRLPAAECVEIAVGVARDVRQIAVGATVVKANFAPTDPVAIGEACHAQAPATLILTYGR